MWKSWFFLLAGFVTMGMILGVEIGDPGRLPPESSHCAIPGGGARTRDRQRFSTHITPHHPPHSWHHRPPVHENRSSSDGNKGGLVGNKVFRICVVCGFPFYFMSHCCHVTSVKTMDMSWGMENADLQTWDFVTQITNQNHGYEMRNGECRPQSCIS